MLLNVALILLDEIDKLATENNSVLPQESCNLDKLQRVIPHNVCNVIKVAVPLDITRRNDVPAQRHTNDGNFMIKSSYKAIVAQKDDNGLYYALYESSDGLKE